MTWHLFITKGHAILETEAGTQLLEFHLNNHKMWQAFLPSTKEYFPPIHEVSNQRLIQYCRSIVSIITNSKTITVHDLRNQ